MKNAEEKKFSISEFAKACGTTKDTLYHYEKQGLLIPAFDENNHYRLYSAADFHRFQYIAHLRRLGFSVPDIRDCLADRNVKVHMQLLEKSRQQCLDEIRELEHRHNIISSSMKAMTYYSTIPKETASVHFAEEMYYYVSPYTAKINSLEGINQFQKHLVAADSLPEVTSNIAGFRISQKSLQDGFSPKMMLLTEADDPDSVPEEHLHIKPQGTYLQMFFNTDIVVATEEDLRRFANTMMRYVEEHNYSTTTDYYAILHIGTFYTDNPDEFLTEFLIGIE